MGHQLAFTPSSRFVAQVARAVFVRQSVWGYALYIACPLLIFGFCLLLDEFVESRAGFGFMGFLLGIAATLAAQLVRTLSSIEKNIVANRRRWPQIETHCEFTEETLTIRSERAAAVYRWDALDGVLRLPFAWVFLINQSSFFAVPLELCDAELNAFIESRAPRNGGKSA